MLDCSSYLSGSSSMTMVMLTKWIPRIFFTRSFIHCSTMSNTSKKRCHRMFVGSDITHLARALKARASEQRECIWATHKHAQWIVVIFCNVHSCDASKSSDKLWEGQCHAQETTTYKSLTCDDMVQARPKQCTNSGVPQHRIVHRHCRRCFAHWCPYQLSYLQSWI